ncbi:MAG: hypothetical protein H7Y04_16720, partial [Verrucomicrobia bacterium]|nr:hypothetical protein [Cytophagales bacterium]
DFVRKLLVDFPLSETEKSNFTALCLAELFSLPPENELVNMVAGGVSQTLAGHFASALKNVNWNVIQDLLRSPVPNIQAIGAMILENHETQPQNFPEGLLTSLIGSAYAPVREIGIRIFGKLPEAFLLENQELIQDFCLSKHPEIRQTIQPIVRNLAANNPDFGRKLMLDLLPYLRQKEVYEGLHDDLFGLFEKALPQFLSEIDTETTLALVHSTRNSTQKLGYFLLSGFAKAENLTIRQIIRLANHEMLDIRTFAWKIYNENIARMRYEAEEALRILDAKWDDSRTFAFDFFRTHFSENDWSPENLVSISDSTRPDVQAFGRELIRKFFKSENGEQYLLQLSQHPTQNVQFFATNYLQQFASDKPENIEKLESYFITVLSQVNKSGTAKARIFDFLEKEALKHESIAQLIAHILTRQSATMAVSDKAHCIKTMRNLKKKYPDLEMALAIKEVV